MAVSQFPPADTGGGLTNDFIINKNGTTNTSFELGRSFEAGGYTLAVTGSTAYDLYLVDAAGSSVGYTTATSVVASSAFEKISALGLATTSTVSFTYNGPSTNATGNTVPGAGAFLVSVAPSDLPNVDDTAIVAGGNFTNNVEFAFISGTVVLPAKNVVVGSSTAVVVTRPDGLINDLSPYSLRAINPGVPAPSRTNANILAGTITAGIDPAFITGENILGAVTGVAFSTAILTSDSEGSVVNWAITSGTIPPGLALATATGAITGTPTLNGDYFFTVRITDSGQNTNSRTFNLPVGQIVSGFSTATVGGFQYFWLTSSNTVTVKNAGNFEVLSIAGGGGGGEITWGGGGGAGGLVFGTAVQPHGTFTATVGAGGAVRTPGNNTHLAGFPIATAIGGGRGADSTFPNRPASEHNGGSGGGAALAGARQGAAGTGTPGQGFNGGTAQFSDYAAGGGGAAAAGVSVQATAGHGGSGASYGAFASAIGIVIQGGFFAGGGGGAGNPAIGTGGIGGGGRSGSGGVAGANGTAQSGGGGGGASNQWGIAGAGGSGLFVMRKAV